MQMREYAEQALSEQLPTDRLTIVDAIAAISDIEGEFDGDFYCPYYHQQADVIAELESDFGRDAEDMASGETFAAADWQRAQTAYAYAIAYCAFSSYFEAAKRELIEALESFESDCQIELETEQTIEVLLSSQCPHGWASHNRECEDGLLVWESGQLDGCNGVARKVGSAWLSCCLEVL